MTPNRVNRAHWPTKEDRQILCVFAFFRSMEKMASDGPKWDQDDFFLLIQTLPTFWAERIWILRILIFLILWTPIFWISRSPDLQISRFPGPQISKSPEFQVPRFPDFQVPPPDELSDPNLTPLPTHPGIKYIARALAATVVSLVFTLVECTLVFNDSDFWSFCGRLLFLM